MVQKSNQLVYYLFSVAGGRICISIRNNNVSEDPRLSRMAGYAVYYLSGAKILQGKKIS